MVLESVEADQILVAVDTLNEGRPADGIVDRVFWYTAQSPLEAPLSERIERANLELGAGVLRVTSPEDPEVFFLFSVRGRQRERSSPAAGSRANVFTNGLALATYTLAPDRASLDNLKSIIEADTEYQDYTPGGSGGTICTAGGVGSTSCSITCSGLSCSVSCGAGYSCCSCSGGSPSCRCK
ncbi:MAG: hypothetical protein ABUT39_25640 [Acidobacteriota bacterium]